MDALQTCACQEVLSFECWVLSGISDCRLQITDYKMHMEKGTQMPTAQEPVLTPAKLKCLRTKSLS
ncbi:MAG: hypothetical protein DRI83_08625 [Bacteroidetes bacterium]|nr:MAG: hypothetical protein DRI83_08625 [Bacteroidota bacterium]